MFHTAIKNALLVDGLTGQQRANVYLSGDTIARISAEELEAQHTVDASGLTLFPGFIDIHRHADLTPFSQEPSIELPQGITTMVSGNCGFSPVPNTPEHFDALRAYAEPIIGRIPDTLRGKDMAGLFQAVAGRPLPLNCGYLAGNGALRVSARGFSSGPLTEDDITLICDRLAQCLEAGALGLSFGLMYAPECYYAYDELCRIAGVAAAFRRPIIAHIRGEGRSLLESVEEMIRIGEETGAAVHISHLKAAGKDCWHSHLQSALSLIAKARGRGVCISFDAYPYTAGSTTLLSLFPPESLAGGTEALLHRLEKLESRDAIALALSQPRDTWDNLAYTTGWDRVMVAGSSHPEDIGKTVMDIALESGTEPAECAMALLLRERGNVPIVIHSMAQEDVDLLMERRDGLVISDSLYSPGGNPHPRKYGAFARFLTRYVKERKTVPLADAIDRITRMPAEFLGLAGRGRLAEGYKADLVLADFSALADRATYLSPKTQPAGIEKVWVNGQCAFEDGKETKLMQGQLLKHCAPEAT